MSAFTDGPAVVRHVAGIHDAIAGDLVGFGGFLRCESCGRQEELGRAEIAHNLRMGWPKCCGHTMRWWTQRQVGAGEVPDLGASDLSAITWLAFICGVVATAITAVFAQDVALVVGVCQLPIVGFAHLAVRRIEARRLKPPVVIIAGNFRQAEYYRKQEGIGPRDYIYATRHGLRGLSGVGTVIRVGTWYANRDLDEIERNLEIACAHQGRRPHELSGRSAR